MNHLPPLYRKLAVFVVLLSGCNTGYGDSQDNTTTALPPAQPSVPATPPTIRLTASEQADSSYQAVADSVVSVRLYGSNDPMSLLSDLSVAQEGCQGGSQVAIHYCSLLSLAEAERELRSAEHDYEMQIREYGVSKYEPPALGPSEEDWFALYQASQLHWRKVRDADCVVQQLQGGSGASIRSVDCLAQKARARAADLREMM